MTFQDRAASGLVSTESGSEAGRRRSPATEKITRLAPSSN